jgi:inner membrane protein
MKTLLSNKYLWLLLILLGLQIPLSMIESQIEDRTRQRETARSAVRSSWTGEQNILAALLVIPYQEKILVKQTYSNASKEDNFQWADRRLYITPQKLDIDTQINNQSLSKGIYRVPVYTADINIDGGFELSSYKKLIDSALKTSIRFKARPFISIGIGDIRGVIGIPSMKLQTTKLTIEPGTRLDFSASGYHAKLNQENLSQANINISSHMQINGMQQLSFLAVARENKVTAKSDWPHPIFSGAFLPTKREVTGEGYTASWQTGVFSTNINTVLESCYQGNCDALNSSLFGVKHIQSVDIYLQSLRSIKYGMLIILVTFGIFVLYEIISEELAIHPISYVLTGFALALFFLLLIALSEHTNFTLAYWVSSLSCSGLIAYYVAYQSRAKAKGLYLMGILNSLYLILFFIIRSEDHALLSGSLLLFFLLAIVMFVTRKVDWFKVLQSA